MDAKKLIEIAKTCLETSDDFCHLCRFYNSKECMSTVLDGMDTTKAAKLIFDVYRAGQKDAGKDPLDFMFKTDYL